MTSQFEIRTGTAADWPAVFATADSAFGSQTSADVREMFERQIDPSRTLVATDRETVVGTAASFAFDMTVPGNTIPVSAISLVTVRPTHTRRGILRLLMRRLVDDSRRLGESVAVLRASEPAIYQRFGFGIGSYGARIEADRHRVAFLGNAEPPARTRIVSEEEALTLFPAVYERARLEIPATFRRSLDWWKLRIVNDPPTGRDGGGPKLRVLLEIDGRPEGYAMYRVHRGWGMDGLHRHWLDALEVIGTTPSATREIWRFIFGVDLIQQVRTRHLGGDHPLLLSVLDPRQLRMRLTDGLWVRVMDVQAALSARRYGMDGALTFEIADELCPWNAGVWELDACGERATVERSTASPELRLTAAELSTMYLGGVACSSLLRAGRVEEVSAGAAHRADVLFRSDVPPWCLDDF